MRYYDDYDIDEYWEDDDDIQDKLYFWGDEKSYKEKYTFDSDRDQIHEDKKYRAALYIRAHFKELMKDEDYKKAYDKLIEEFARATFYLMYRRLLVAVSEKERELENVGLDLEISTKGKGKIESYKEDAIYIVEWVKAGKNLIVYV